MLWHRGEALVQEVLDVVVVGADDEGTSPQIGASVSYSLHQADQLSLVCCQLEMASNERSTDESEGSSTLVYYCAEPHAQCIAVDHEWFVEVRHLQNRACGQGNFQRLEGCLGVVVLRERSVSQEAC